jgi:hypothetical protein
MSLGIYVTLDQSIIYNDNYSDVSGFRLTGTIYSDIGKTVAFDTTGYTIKLRFSQGNGKADAFNQTCTATVAASGTFHLAVTTNTLPEAGLYLAHVELSKSGSIVTSLNRSEMLIRRGP